MENHDFKKFRNAFGTLCEVFDKKLSPILISAYFQALSGYPINQVENSMSQAIARCRFFPRPVELVEFIIGPNQPEAQQLEDIALAQAHTVLRQVTAVGRYGNPFFEDPITKSLMSSRFSFLSLCNTLVDSENQWFVKEFCEAYQAFNRVGIIEAPESIKRLSANIGGAELPAPAQKEKTERFIPPPRKPKLRVVGPAEKAEHRAKIEEQKRKILEGKAV